MAAAEVTLLLTLVAVTVAQGPPAKCCAAERFSASVLDLSSVSGNELRILDAEYDFVAGKKAVVSYLTNPSTGVSNTTGRTVFDYNKGKEYYLPADEPSKCYVKDLPIRPPRGIPDDAQYLGSTYLGLPSSLPYDAWRYNVTGSNTTVSLAVSTNSCVPIIEGVSDKASPDKKVFLFTAYDPRIWSPEWFDLPPTCSQ